MIKKRYRLITILSILVIVFIILGVYKIYQNEKTSKNGRDSTTILNKQNEFIQKHKYLSEGSNNKIHVIAFTDYRCPQCADYHTEIKNKLLSKYIDNKTVKYTEIQYPVIDDISKEYEKMSLVIQKYGNIDDFKQFSDKSYQSSTIDDNPIKTLKRIKFNNKKEKMFLNHYKENSLKSNKSEINSKLKISSTPTIFVNGKYIKDTSVLEDGIKQEVKNHQ